MDVFDILLDDDFDLLIEGGDLVMGESSLQHQALLLLSNKGDWRESPAVGVGLNNYLLADGAEAELRQAIRKEFELDGMRVGRIETTDELPLIEASYE